jgi:hypothetical protein
MRVDGFKKKLFFKKFPEKLFFAKPCSIFCTIPCGDLAKNALIGAAWTF